MIAYTEIRPVLCPFCVQGNYVEQNANVYVPLLEQVFESLGGVTLQVATTPADL